MKKVVITALELVHCNGTVKYINGKLIEAGFDLEKEIKREIDQETADRIFTQEEEINE